MNTSLLKQNLENIVYYLHDSDIEKVKGDIEELWKALKHIDELKRTSITWTVYDFEIRAKFHYKDDWETVYDSSKFPRALEEMIRKHDTNNGIAWETIDYYLENFCKNGED